MMLKPGKWVVRLVVSTVFLGFSLISSGCSSAQPGESATPTPIPTSAVASSPTYTVQRGEIINELRFKGRIEPVSLENLSFRSCGYVRKVYAGRGDLVKTGQVLADLEINDLENQLAQAKINLQASEDQLTAVKQAISDSLADAQITLTIENLRLDEAKYNLQINGGSAQKIALQIQEQMVKLAELKVERLQRGPDLQTVQAVSLARLTVDRLQAQVNDSSITAPFDGQLLAINIQKGDQVTPFSQTVMTICDPTQLEVGAVLNPQDLNNLAEGMQVTVKLSLGTKDPMQGVVRSLHYHYGKGSQETQANAGGSETANTRITLETSPTDGGYKLGDLVDIQVVLERHADALWLPPEAIRNFDGRRFVVVQEGDNQRRVNVTIGISTDKRVEITEGLSEGQIVVGQ